MAGSSAFHSAAPRTRRAGQPSRLAATRGQPALPPARVDRRGHRDAARARRRRCSQGVRVRDLQRLAPDVLARRPAARLPADARRRLQPPGRGPPGLHRHRGLAGDGRAAGAPSWASTAASARAEIVDGALHRAAPAARSPTARARPGDARARRARGHRPRRVVGVLRLGVRPADAARGRAPGGGQPGRASSRASRARRAGRSCASSGSGGGCASPARRAGRRRWPAARRVAPAAARAARLRSADEPARADRRTARDPRARAALRRRADRPARRRVGPRAPFPRELFAQLGELGLMGVCVPRSTAARAPTSSSYVLVLEELSRADAGVGVTVAVHTSAGHAADPRPRHGRAGRALRPAAGAGPRARGVRADRGRARARTPARCARAPRRRRASAAHEAVDHQRLARAHVLVFARERASGIERVRRARAARRRLRGHARGGEARPELLLDRRPRLRGHARPSGSASRAAGCGSRCARSTAGASASPPRRSGSRRPALDLATGYAKERNAFGAPDRRLRRDPAEARRHADRDRGGARAVWRAARAQGGGPAAHGRGRAGQAVRQPRSRAARPARRSRCSAATATPRSSRPSATTATPRSPRSTRARARSSGS